MGTAAFCTCAHVQPAGRPFARWPRLASTCCAYSKRAEANEATKSQILRRQLFLRRLHPPARLLARRRAKVENRRRAIFRTRIAAGSQRAARERRIRPRADFQFCLRSARKSVTGSQTIKAPFWPSQAKLKTRQDKPTQHNTSSSSSVLRSQSGGRIAGGRPAEGAKREWLCVRAR